MKENSKSAAKVTKSAIIAALYVLLTILSSAFGLSNGVVQLRFSEILTVLPMFSSATVPGLFIGCILANIITGSLIWDTVFGSVATLLGALGTYYLRKKSVYLAQLSPVIANTIIIPFVLKYAYHIPNGIPVLMILVGIGEMVSAWLLGSGLYKIIKKNKIQI